jgi:hypothetical protein
MDHGDRAMRGRQSDRGKQQVHRRPIGRRSIEVAECNVVIGDQSTLAGCHYDDRCRRERFLMRGDGNRRATFVVKQPREEWQPALPLDFPPSQLDPLWSLLPGFDHSANVDLIAIYLNGRAIVFLVLMPSIPG